MASDLFTIGASGVKAARTALEITSQNIANAATDGYIRRSVRLSEMAGPGSWLRVSDLSLSGVRVDGISRNADVFRQVEVRRTSGDAARASTELRGFENMEAALEQSALFPALTSFEAGLQRLSSDPVNPSLRAAVLEDARTLTRTFNLAASALDTAGEGQRFEAADGTAQVNLLAGELGRVNLQLTRTNPGTSDSVTLLDQRDTLLQRLSGYGDIAVSYAPDQTVEVRMGGGATPLVSGGTAAPLAMSANPDGTLAFTLGADPVTFSSGKLAGQAQTLTALRDNRAALDGIADSLIAAANTAQASGVALNGTPGQPLFSGSGAAGIAVALAAAEGLATAPAGAAAGSRDPAGLTALRAALEGADISGRVDGLLFGVSSAVAGRRVTSEALDAIASSARIALDEQAGVDLDQEAANLVRFQQAFQASGKALQVASDIFDTLLGLK